MSSMVVHRDPDGSIRFEGRIDCYDLMKLKLDPFDRKMVDECGQSTSEADWLLGLECLFRRMKEQGIFSNRPTKCTCCTYIRGSLTGGHMCPRHGLVL